VLAAETVDDVEASMRALSAWLATAEPQRLNVWLSAGLCRPMLMAPVDGLKTHAEWLRVAEAMVSAQTGLSEPCEVWVERRSDSAGRRMAAAVPKAFLAQLQHAVAHTKTRARISRIAPWWSEPLRASADTPGAPEALAVRDCDSLTLLAGRDREIESVALYTPMREEAVAQSTLSRALMNIDVALGAELVARLVVSGPARGAAGHSGALSPLTEWSR
jgi:hypothetical protein